MKHSKGQTFRHPRALHWVLSATGLILCAIFGLLLACNLTIIIKGTLDPSRPPSIMGTTPMVVLSGSMSGSASDHIEIGDLIIMGKVAPKELKVGDVISYIEENATTVVTHRIVGILRDDNGSLSFQTKGDANNIADDLPVRADQVIGIFQRRIPKLGDFALFLQEPLGMVLFAGLPLLAFIIYDILRRQHYANRDRKNSEALEAELTRLREMVDKSSQNANF